jgi:protein-tyrosine-phosphatase
MAGFMLDYLSEVNGSGLSVATAGTHVVDGQPISRRTRAAITAIDALADVPMGSHRSRQVDLAALDRADVVIGMEADHVRFVRRQHPTAADRTATLRRLCRDLPPGSGTRPVPVRDRVAALDLATVTLTDDEDVDDPAGHDDDVYAACARQLWDLCQVLVERL